MNYGEIRERDIANGPGFRTSLFVSGCRNHCAGCFQPETWNFNYGSEFTPSEFDKLVDAVMQPWIRGLSVLGGDPLELENQKTVSDICWAIKTTAPEKDIWLYTGYSYEDVTQKYPWILECVDVVVDGKFEENKKVLGEFRGSSNQRIIDVVRTKSEGEIVIWESEEGK